MIMDSRTDAPRAVILLQSRRYAPVRPFASRLSDISVFDRRGCSRKRAGLPRRSTGSRRGATTGAHAARSWPPGVFDGLKCLAPRTRIGNEVDRSPSLV